MYPGPGPLADTFRLRDEIARSLLDEADERSDPTAHPRRPDEDRTTTGSNRADEVDLLTGGAVPPERR